MTTIELLGKADLLGTPGSIMLARMYVREVLLRAGHPASSRADDIVLIAGEVVANAIKHSRSGSRPGGVVNLLVYGDARTVRVEVADEGSSDTIPRIPAQTDPLSESGRGLWLVRELSSAWGWRQDDTGHTVWFELSTTPGTPAGTAAPGGG
ncbi:ATP-binding protein [Sphaerisporangium album]|uniref:ATP-binding protein n=1 Tax=Sphaerisporangium album TaxID=509200 RepID=A0A367F5D8_9ACTN|nr:ATP-binding protein [Sphaerisporangium album]RCG25072.1 ATP-binding protein [Sphaerisporangium album]